MFTNGKNLTVKTPPGDFQVTTPETPLLSQQVVTSKGIPSTLSTYSWTLTPIPNWTCSVVTVPLSNARLPSTWLTIAQIPVRDFNNTNWEDCQLQSSLVHLHDKDQEDVWSQNPTVHIHNNFFKRNRWTRARTSSLVTIYLNRVCLMFVQLLNCLMALKNNLFICLGLGEKKAQRHIYRFQENHIRILKFLNLDK